MELRQLRYFIAMVEAGSISAAAERVHVAQSALSLHLRRMEERLGVRLLVRGARGVRPTEAGEILLNRAREVLSMVHQIERDLRSTGKEPAGAVSIGIPSGVGRILNAPLLEACARELPRIVLLIVEVLPGSVSDWLQAGRIDLGISYDIGDEQRLSALAEEESYLVCGAPETAFREGIALEDLARIPLVLPVCTYNPEQCVATRARAAGIELEIEARVDSLATILDLVANRSARSVLTPGAFLPEWRTGQICAYPIKPAMRRTVHVEVSSSASAEPAVEAAVSLVRRTAAALVANGSWPQRLPSPFPIAA